MPLLSFSLGSWLLSLFSLLSTVFGHSFKLANMRKKDLAFEVAKNDIAEFSQYFTDRETKFAQPVERFQWLPYNDEEKSLRRLASVKHDLEPRNGRSCIYGGFDILYRNGKHYPIGLPCPDGLGATGYSDVTGAMHAIQRYVVRSLASKN
jgi:hypothetical protein